MTSLLILKKKNKQTTPPKAKHIIKSQSPLIKDHILTHIFRYQELWRIVSLWVRKYQTDKVAMHKTDLSVGYNISYSGIRSRSWHLQRKRFVSPTFEQRLFLSASEHRALAWLSFCGTGRVPSTVSTSTTDLGLLLFLELLRKERCKGYYYWNADLDIFLIKVLWGQSDTVVKKMKLSIVI